MSNALPFFTALLYVSSVRQDSALWPTKGILLVTVTEILIQLYVGRENPLLDLLGKQYNVKVKAPAVGSDSALTDWVNLNTSYLTSL